MCIRDRSSNDIEKAKQDFLLAMNSFMQISRIMSQSSDKVIVVTVSENSTQNLQSQLDRLEKYVKTLESISKKHNKIEQNRDEFTKAYSLIENIRNQINSGENTFENMNDLKNLINSIKNDIRDSIAEKQSNACLLYTSPSPRDLSTSRMPSSA